LKTPASSRNIADLYASGVAPAQWERGCKDLQSDRGFVVKIEYEGNFSRQVNVKTRLDINLGGILLEK
jgi:hypothetical protein